MKKNYQTFKTIKAAGTGIKLWILVLVLAGLSRGTSFAQTSYSFTPCGATGQYGPTQAQCTAAYSLTNLNGSVTIVTQGIQQFTVPLSGLYRVVCYGAASGGIVNNYGCRGKIAQGEVNFTAGQVLKILVGQKSVTGSTSTGGGGGSYVVTFTNSPICIGGGGAGYCSPLATTYTTTDGQISTNGQTSTDGTGAGGSGGNGGSGNSGQWGGGGGGFSTSGTAGAACAGSGGSGFLQGGTGGGSCYNSYGGFGGGGGTHGNTGGGGGGGGYSGGGGSGQTPSTAAGGGGGSFFMAGMTNTLDAGFNGNDGLIVITRLCNISLVSTANPICAGATVTLTTDAVSGYSWSNGSTNASIIVSPTVNTTYSLVGTSTANCSTSALLTITVSAGLPVLSVNSSTNSVCLGKTVTLTANGALSYTWTNGVINGVTYTPQVTNAYTVTGQNGCGTSTAVTTVTVAPLFVGMSATPSVICASSPANLLATSAATSFIWQPFGPTGSLVTVNPSVTTVYTVTASDGTCAGTGTLMLSAKPVPTINVSASNTVVCVGALITMTAGGGLSYTWTPGNLTGNIVTINPQAPTLYSVVGSNSLGCLGGAPQIILTNPSPTVNVSSTNSFVCRGTPVYLTASGANSYNWNTGPTTNTILVTPSTTTSYTVIGTVQGNTCTTSQAITVAVFSPTLGTTGTSTVCSGSNVTLTACCADSYTWDSGAFGNLVVVSPTVNTTYTVSATTASNNVFCPVQMTIPVTVNPKPNVTAAITKTVICRNETSVLSGGGATGYTWTSPSGGAIVGSPVGQSVTVSPSITVLFTYSVTGSDANGCTNIASVALRVSACSGISSVSGTNDNIMLYPNPSNGEFTIENGTEITLNLCNELGQVLKTIQLNENNHYKVQVTDLANGIYLLSGQNSQGKVNQKVVINK